jgi:CheY-like chemotaxis protein
MSHEIRTPLNGILGFADVLLNQIDGDAKDRRDYLHVIHDSGRHLLDLINDVLDLSKIESGQMEVERVHCSPHEIIASTISILRVRAEERGLSLDYFWKSEIPETIHTDSARLRQILMNLIANAIKFTEVGSVQVAARVRRDTDGAMQLVVDVIDTGVGIPADSIERIFEPFVQADNSITRRFGGTGLGLSISRRLARLLDGELTVNSEPGRGSIFSVSVPTGSLDGVRWQQGSVSDLARNRLTDDPTKFRVLPPCRILLVEDGITNRNLMKVVLGNAGAAVRCAENGQVGVDAAKEEPFDLILMDMQMPVMDGYSATRELRRLGLKTPIIALTAHAMAGDERKCRDAGCSGYLTKPIEPRTLLDAVGEVLVAEQALRQRSATNDEAPIVSRLLLDNCGDFREIVDEVIVRLEEKIEAIHVAWKNSDFEELAEIAHWIKGSAGTAGFDAFTAPASRLEKLATASNTNGMGEVIHELDKLLRRIQLPVSS